MSQDSEKRTFEVKSSEDLGRHLVACRDLSPGEIVLTERPLVFGPKSTQDAESIMPCVGCYKAVPSEQGERCSKCGWPICSGNCPGLKEFSHHAAECGVLSARPDCALYNLADYYRHDALLPLRCLLLQKTNPESWVLLLKMQSHMESRQPGCEAYEETDELIVKYLWNNFIQRLDENTRKELLPVASEDLLHRICGIIDTNALEIRLGDSVELNALYENTCIMEHSCLPNTRHSFNLTGENFEMYSVIVKTVVPTLCGDHISTMYTHLLWGTQARRQHLKDTKYFACRCVRCSDATELGTFISAMKCLGDNDKSCNGIHLPDDPLDDESDWSCNKCPVKIKSSVVYMLVSQMGQEVENVQMAGGSLELLENLLCRLSTFLHPNHYHLYSIKHSLVQLYGRQPKYINKEILTKKVAMCRDLLRVTKVLDPGNARLSLYSAVLYHELHSAFLELAKIDDVNTENGRNLIKDANLAIQDALLVLEDEKSENSAQKLYDVISRSKECFRKYCEKNNVNF